MEKCTHCQSEITHTKIEESLASSQGETLVFCCLGCQKVYHILNADEFQTYHHILEIENSAPPRARKSPKYHQYLDEWFEEDKWATQGQWKNGHQFLNLASDEIHCAACSWLLEKKLSECEGLSSVRVDFVHGTLALSYQGDQNQLRPILETAAELGYPLKFESPKVKSTIQRTMLIRLAISGAVMMNVMTFSYGSYFAIDGGMSDGFKNLFGILSAILNIPVVTYAAWPFYSKAWKGLKAGVFHMDLPVSMGIIIAYLLSLLLLLQGEHTYFDSVSSLVFFLLAGRWFSQSFERWLTPDPRWFDHEIPDYLETQVGDKWTTLPLSEVSIGSLVRLRRDQVLPFECVLKSKEALMESSWMTGESRPHTIFEGQTIPSGFRNISGTIEVESRELHKDSQLKQLQNSWLELNQVKLEKSQGESGEKIVPYFVLAVLVLALIRFGFLFWSQGDLWYALQEAMVVLIISCPCALALARPLSQGMAMKKARELGYLLKDGSVFEKMQDKDAFLFDKTGTLTWTWHPLKNWLWSESLSDVEKSTAKSVLKSLVQSSHHPYARSLYEELGEEQSVSLTEIREVPALGLEGVFQPEDSESSVWKCISAREIQKQLLSPSEDSSSVKSNFPHVSLDQLNSVQNVLLRDDEVVAFIEFEAAIRPGVSQMLEGLQAEGKSSHLLSGDQSESVHTFAKEVGFTHFQGNMSPEQKADYCKNLQAKGSRVVAMGDGINDALLLGEADLSMVVQGGSTQLGDNADILCVGEAGQDLHSFFALPRKLKRSTFNAYFLSIMYNLGVLAFAFSGMVAPLVAAIAMPLSTLSVILMVKWSMRD